MRTLLGLDKLNTFKITKTQAFLIFTIKNYLAFLIRKSYVTLRFWKTHILFDQKIVKYNRIFLKNDPYFIRLIMFQLFMQKKMQKF
jgi:hypothetical protein